MANDCIFCKIVNGELPAERLYDDDRIIAILDIYPANKGHVLVIPKKHYETFDKVPEEELYATISIVKRFVQSVITALHAEGVNVHVNSGPAAGPLVKHTHIHIIPRFKDDGLSGLSLTYDAKKYETGELKDYATKIKRAMK